MSARTTRVGETGGKRESSLIRVEAHVAQPANLLARNLREVNHELGEGLVLVGGEVADVLEQAPQPPVVRAVLRVARFDMSA